MTVFSPEKAAFVAVNSAFPRLVRGRLGRSGEDDAIILTMMLFTARCVAMDERRYDDGDG